MSEYPTVNYPTILKGKIYSDVIRMESLAGGELYLTGNESFESPKNSLIRKSDHWQLNNFGPITLNGKIWGVTHLQKQSSRGWLKVTPDCYHWWYWFKKQQQDALGNWLPGTEKGLYFRKPFSWRWDLAGTMIDGNLDHWIRTKGYLGGHWD